MILIPMQAVCILARELSPEAEPMIRAVANFQIEKAQEVGNRLKKSRFLSKTIRLSASA